LKRIYLFLSRDAAVEPLIQDARAADPWRVTSTQGAIAVRIHGRLDGVELRFSAGPTGWTQGFDFTDEAEHNVGAASLFPAHALRAFFVGQAAEALALHCPWGPSRDSTAEKAWVDANMGLRIRSRYRRIGADSTPSVELEATPRMGLILSTAQLRHFLLQLSRYSSPGDIDPFRRILNGPTAAEPDLTMA
jgi:hypothetical protein